MEMNDLEMEVKYFSDVFTCEITEIEDTYLNVKRQDNRYIKLDRNHIKEVKNHDVVLYPEFYLRKKPYFNIGLTLGSPAGLNAVYVRHFENSFGYRVQGGFDPFISPRYKYGLQGNFLYNFSKSKNFEHNISIGAGFFNGILKIEYRHIFTHKILYTEDVKIRKQFAGLFYDLNYKNWFLELGYVASTENEFSSNIMGQIGYVYRFNKI